MAFREATVHPGGVAVQLAPARRRGAPAGAGGAGGEAAELRTVPARGADDAVRAHPRLAARRSAHSLAAWACSTGGQPELRVSSGGKCLGNAAELRTVSASGAMTQRISFGICQTMGCAGATHRWYVHVQLHCMCSAADWCVHTRNAYAEQLSETQLLRVPRVRGHGMPASRE